MEQLTKMTFPEGYVCQHRENILALANMIGRKKPGLKAGDKGGYNWDDPEYVILEAGVTDEMCEVGLVLGSYVKKSAAEVAALVGQQQRLPLGIAALGQHPGRLLDIARSVEDELRVERIAQVELGAPAMRGHQHAAQGVDEGADPVPLEIRAQGIAQRRHVAPSAQLRQRLVQLDGLVDRLFRRLPAGQAGLAPFTGVALVQLAHQLVQAGQVIAHGQGGHAVDIALQQLAGLRIAVLADDGLMLQPPGAAAQHQRHEHQSQRGRLRDSVHRLAPAPVKSLGKQ